MSVLKPRFEKSLPLPLKTKQDVLNEKIGGTIARDTLREGADAAPPPRASPLDTTTHGGSIHDIHASGLLNTEGITKNLRGMVDRNVPTELKDLFYLGVAFVLIAVLYALFSCLRRRFLFSTKSE